MAAYKDLSHAEQDFRTSKDDLDLRPVWHRLAGRVKAHVLICMLACHLSWHLRQAWAPLTYADEHPPHRDNRSPPPAARPQPIPKAARKTTTSGQPARSFRDLLNHLATLTRDTIIIGGHQIDKITTRDPRPAAGLRPPRRTHPDHLGVDTSKPTQNHEPPAKQGVHLPRQT